MCNYSGINLLKETGGVFSHDIGECWERKWDEIKRSMIMVNSQRYK